MNLNEESSKLDKIYNETQEKLSEALSKILRSIDTKENRIYALNKMEKTPSVESLKRVHNIGIRNEDYETCEAIKEFCQKKGIKF